MCVHLGSVAARRSTGRSTRTPGGRPLTVPLRGRRQVCRRAEEREVPVEEVESLIKQEVNSDRILRDGDEMDGYGDEGAKNVMRDVCEPSDGREEACPTVTARRTSRARAQALSSDARQHQSGSTWPRRTRSTAMWMCPTTCDSVPCGRRSQERLKQFRSGVGRGAHPARV